MFLSHESSFFFLAKFDDHIYPFAWYNGPKQLSQGQKGLYGTLSDPSTSSDPDALSDAKSTPRIAPKVILAHVGLFLLNNADLECGASKLKTWFITLILTQGTPEIKDKSNEGRNINTRRP